LNSFNFTPELHLIALIGVVLYFIISCILKTYYIFSLRKTNHFLRQEISEWALWLILIPVVGSVLMGIFSSIIAYQTKNVFIYNRINRKTGLEIAVAMTISVALAVCGLIIFGAVAYIFMIWFWFVMKKNNDLLKSYHDVGNLKFPY